MTWWGWILLGLYLLGASLMWRKAAYVVAMDLSFTGHLDANAVTGGLMVGLFAAPVWPIVWVLYAIHQRDPDYSVLVAAPRNVRRQRKVAELQKRICDLERELRVGR